MMSTPIKLQDFLAAARQDTLAALLLQLADTVGSLAQLIAQGAIGDLAQKLEQQNVQGETQLRLDLLGNDLFVARLRAGGLVRGIVSEEMDEPCPLAAPSDEAPYLVLFDPLDGSSNVAVNVAVGSIFSVLAAPDGRPAAYDDYLQPGARQLAAGYALYGPATMLVLTLGQGTHGFTLDPATREFVLTHPEIRIPPQTAEFAVNASNARFWEPPVKRYIAECTAGRDDVRGRDFNMRWVASMVADVHRILMRGGVYLYPKDHKEPARAGRLRLLYEAGPMAMLVEQAGGLASTGRARLLDVVPENVHQRVPVIVGARDEVLRLERYHQEYDSGLDDNGRPPFFSDRSFYR